MGRGARSTEARVSFFAFQDIITAVIGILVLIALILALQLNPETDDPGDKTATTTDPIERNEDDDRNGTDFNATQVVEVNATELQEKIAMLEQMLEEQKNRHVEELDEKKKEEEVLRAQLEELPKAFEALEKPSSPAMRILDEQIEEA
ncbi:uncharacterized protein METZ01_LOCUS392435, partial [marine metagenome]